jgi:DNA-binding NarL/FixJ family response regulator
VIADDSVLLREGITRLLAEGGIDVAAGVGDAEALLTAVATEQPGLAIIDVRMPPHTGMKACEPPSRSAAAGQT